MLFLTRHVGEAFSKFATPLIVGAGTVGTGVYIWLTDGLQEHQKTLSLSSQKLSKINQENEALTASIENLKLQKDQSREKSERLSQTLHLLKMKAILNYMTQQYSSSVDQFRTAKDSLISNIDTNEALKSAISGLESEIKISLEDLKRELQKIKTNMPDLHKGVLKDTKYKNFASIKIHETTVVKKETEQTTFTGRGKESDSVDFTIKKDTKLFTLETSINNIKKDGIKFTLNANNLKQWNGDFYLTESRRCWDCKLPVASNSKATSSLYKVKENQKLNIKNIFNESNQNIYHNAVKLLEVISRIQSISFNQVGNSSTVFEIESRSETNLSNISSPISKEAWTKNDELNKWNIEIHSFGSQEDFIKYWILKTIELTVNKKVDLSQLLDAIYKKESYS